MENKIVYNAYEGWREPTITKVETTRTSDSSIWFIGHNGREVCVRRVSNYERYFDTFEEAKEYLNNKLNDKFKQITNKMIEIQNDLDVLEKITEDNVK